MKHGDTRPLLEVENLQKFYPIRKGLIPHVVGNVQAVNDVSFALSKQETLGLVGESGCGKTTVGRCVLRLIEPTGGAVRFDGANVLALSTGGLRTLRRRMQIIFQDPYSSLNPRHTVAETVGDAMRLHGLARSRAACRDRVAQLLERVGLNRYYVNRYPHEFSGGQRQRIGIARALAVEPEFIVCDEAVSALDVSIQAQILNLLADLQREMNLAYLFIAHDLAVVRHISDRVVVMYLGKIMEIAAKNELFGNPLHPYTQALLTAVPEADPDIEKNRKRIILGGDVSNAINPPSGCRFHTRCSHAVAACSVKEPPLRDIGDGHFVACHLVK